MCKNCSQSELCKECSQSELCKDCSQSEKREDCSQSELCKDCSQSERGEDCIQSKNPRCKDCSQSANTTTACAAIGTRPSTVTTNKGTFTYQTAASLFVDRESAPGWYTVRTLTCCFRLQQNFLGPYKQHSFGPWASWALRRSCGSATLTHCSNGKIMYRNNS